MTESHPATRRQAWPSLALEAWQDSCATLHMWTQIVGKLRASLERDRGAR
jgi:hypothetical protein